MKTLDHIEQLAKASPTTHVRVGMAICDGKEHVALWFDDNSDHIAKAQYLNATKPDTILQLIALLRQMHGALEGMSYWAQPRKTDKPELCGFECKQGDMSFCDAEEALAAFDAFENGE